MRERCVPGMQTPAEMPRRIRGTLYLLRLCPEEMLRFCDLGEEGRRVASSCPGGTDPQQPPPPPKGKLFRPWAAAESHQRPMPSSFPPPPPPFFDSNVSSCRLDSCWPAWTLDRRLFLGLPRPCDLPLLQLPPPLPPSTLFSYEALYLHQHGAGAKVKKQRPKRFPCPHCHVAFSNNGQLKGHVRIHTGERPFRCDNAGCGKTFTRNEELTRHKRIHSGVRPYACVVCAKKFGRKDHLKKHVKTHQKGPPLLLPPPPPSSSFPGLPL